MHHGKYLAFLFYLINSINNTEGKSSYNPSFIRDIPKSIKYLFRWNEMNFTLFILFKTR